MDVHTTAFGIIIHVFNLVVIAEMYPGAIPLHIINTSAYNDVKLKSNMSKDTNEPGPTPVECRFLEWLCPDGQCRPSYNSCPGQCNSLEKECKDKTCVFRFQMCPGECGGFRSKLCADGSCTMEMIPCVEPGCTDAKPKKCPDGNCIRTFLSCFETCPLGKKRCRSGACIEPRRPCLEGCGEMMSCASGSTCYSEHQVCDGMSDCLDGEDEQTCIPTSSSENSIGWPWIMILPVLGTIASVGFCVAYHCQRLIVKNEDSGSSLRARILQEGTNVGPITAGALPGNEASHSVGLMPQNREDPFEDFHGVCLTPQNRGDSFHTPYPGISKPPPYNELQESSHRHTGEHDSDEKPPSYEAVVGATAPSAPPMYTPIDCTPRVSVNQP